MLRISSRKRTFLVGFVIGAVLAVLALLLWNGPVQPRVEARVPSVYRSNNIFMVTVLLTNGMPRSVNIVDDTAGKPHFALEWYGDPGLWLGELARQQKVFLEPGTNLLSLTALGNKGTIYLASGHCLTNTVVLTNPPPRFRLMVSVRDTEAHKDLGFFAYWLSRASFGALDKWLGKVNLEGGMQEPRTPWIEFRKSH